jgi:hypothetical protein
VAPGSGMRRLRILCLLVHQATQLLWLICSPHLLAGTVKAKCTPAYTCSWQSIVWGVQLWPCMLCCVCNLCIVAH